jgi:long-chain acyl-CoA synthetase
MRFPLAQGYGMSELSAAASFCVNRVYKAGSVGIPSLDLNVGIFDPETGKELGYKEIGEVCVTGDSMMKGYFNKPEETAHVMRKHDDGLTWIHSGDLGYMDEDGFLYIKGRIKRMITRFDGHKVFPINLESMIMERPDVHNCAVVGTDDMEHSQGQYPMALVELVKDVDAVAVCKRIYDYCNTNAEERGRPVAVVAVDALPLTPMGKVDNKKLEAEYKSFDYLSWLANNKS